MRKFHVGVVQQLDKEMYKKKSVIQMHVQSCCFANPKPIGFFAILVAVAAVVA